MCLHSQSDLDIPTESLLELGAWIMLQVMSWKKGVCRENSLFSTGGEGKADKMVCFGADNETEGLYLEE